MTADQIISLHEKNKYDMSKNLRMGEYITPKMLNDMSSERIFVAFMNSVNDLIDMDVEDYADHCNVYPEWVVEKCWERMDPEYKEQILAAIPHINNYMEWQSINPETSWDFREFMMNAFSRLVWCEKAEIIKRAQTKLLKEEIAMKVMHPDRVEKLAATYGMEPDDYLDMLD